MQILSGEILRTEPDTRICTTEQITGELSRCSLNKQDCQYGLPAGKTSTYCLHPDNRKFLMLS